MSTRTSTPSFSEWCPDVMVLDLLMPEMDGFEFLVEMRQRPEWRDIPVLVLTAKDLSVEDQKQLNGYVAQAMRKNASELGELLRELGRMLPRPVRPGQQPKG